MKFRMPMDRIASDLWANSRLKTITRIFRPRGMKILDLGCSSGYMGEFYAGHNDVHYADIRAEAMADLDVPESHKHVVDATAEMPFPDATFDVVFCADMLEHVADDDAVLQNIHRVLKPGGRLLVTVPAYSRLYGHHDKLAGHLRRYDRAPFLAKARAIGFETLRARYLCPLLFAPFWVNQRMAKCAGAYQGRSSLEPKILPLLNFFAWLDSAVPLPFGIGILFLFEKRSHVP